MTVEEMLQRMSALELHEWSYLVNQKDEKPSDEGDVDTQLMKIFGKPNGPAR
jgi:hypothetical protein